MNWEPFKNLNPVNKIQEKREEKRRAEEEERRRIEEERRKAEEAKKAAEAKKKKRIIIGSIAGGAALTLIFAIGIISERNSQPKYEVPTYSYSSLFESDKETEEQTILKPTEATTEALTEKATEKPTQKPTQKPTEAPKPSPVNLSAIPSYSGKAYVEINNNVPEFTEYTTSSYEYYSDLDSLGRCGVCYACIGKDLMPTEERGSIGMVKPSGWQTVKYDNVDGKYLYNRCHLIGYQLTGENANEKNLITGTRYLNIQGMLPFENLTADYIKETNTHVLYRVTPIFEGNNLLASGVHMEGYSVEDSGDGVSFNVYCYNVQPDIEIDYSDGSSYALTVQEEKTEAPAPAVKHNDDNNNSGGGTGTYILNTNTKKFHYPSCSSVNQMSDKNKQSYSGSRDDLIAQGYSPCQRCNP